MEPSTSLLSSALGILPDGLRLPVLRGPLRGWRWSVGAGDPSCWTGGYGIHEQTYVRTAVSRGDVVYDVGAGPGFFTLLFSRLVGESGRVVSFEPEPETRALLLEHLRTNGVENVTVNESAVADFRGRSGLRRNGGGKGGGRLADGDGDLEVDVTTLQEVTAATGLSPTFLRIDTPASELAVLEGGRSLLRDRHPAVLFTAETEQTVRRCRRLLHDEGYRLRPLGPSGSRGGWEFAAEPPSVE